MEDPFLCLIFGPGNLGMMERRSSSAWGPVTVRDPPLVPSPQTVPLTSTKGGAGSDAAGTLAVDAALLANGAMRGCRGDGCAMPVRGGASRL